MLVSHLGFYGSVSENCAQVDENRSDSLVKFLHTSGYFEHLRVAAAVGRKHRDKSKVAEVFVYIWQYG